MPHARASLSALHFTLLATLLASVTASALAQPPLAAHQHGVAQLQLAQLGEVLEIELTTPAFNLTGFEHAPRDAAERRAAEHALALLNDPAALFPLPPAADCQLQRLTIDAGVLQPASADHDHDHDHDQHHHDHDHDHDHSDDHGHADVSASYSYQCGAPQQLRTLSIELFRHLPRLERLEAQWLTETRQQARTLRAGDHEVSLQ